MYDVLVLVCSLAATPALGDCTIENAIAALRLPERVAAAAGCSMLGQAYLAQTELGRSLAAGEAVKVVCYAGSDNTGPDSALFQMAGPPS